ncbi:MAG TPA: patatin-like phospholipase family protein [Xanthobacteraceae bacterium]|nr:patatin-like phospholipase family protein [Xanthobacteraceae bacterium]
MRRGRDDNQDEDASPLAPEPRPVVALALGGGAARGFAHIGVLRALIANGIKPDIIVGTSIGAVAGGCFAGGALDTFEEWARSLTVRGVLGYLDVSLSGSGLIGGNRLAQRLEKALGKTLIEDLPLTFAAIATEVRTGHEIWLTHGRLVEALRASYALPGIFPPIRVGGRWLVDGALVNPVPVSPARALGARVVVAVNLNADQFGRSTTVVSHGADHANDEEDAALKRAHGLGRLFSAERALKRQFVGSPGRPGLSSVMVDAFNVMQDRITRSRLAGDPPDVSINPRLGRVGWFDFHRAAEAIQLGAEAAEKSCETIKEAIVALA